jgi:hypothetical protein
MTKRKIDRRTALALAFSTVCFGGAAFNHLAERRVAPLKATPAKFEVDCQRRSSERPSNSIFATIHDDQAYIGDD